MIIVYPVLHSKISIYVDQSQAELGLCATSTLAQWKKCGCVIQTLGCSESKRVRADAN